MSTKGQPEINSYGVPFCTTSECSKYDGKRCELLGFRPGNICEPAVMDMAAAARASRPAPVEVRGVEAAVDTIHNGDVMYVYDDGRSWGWLPAWPGAHVGQRVIVHITPEE